jgi:GNAT superfamily N-acetyltransferase
MVQDAERLSPGSGADPNRGTQGSTRKAPTVRRASATDAVELGRLRWDSSTEDGPVDVDRGEFLNRCKRFVKDALTSGWHVWVAEYDGRLVANAWVYEVPKVPRPWPEHRDRLGYLTNVYTEPAFRNAGVGSEILKEISEWADKRGLDLLIVWPSEQSVSIYLRAGFETSD